MRAYKEVGIPRKDVNVAQVEGILEIWKRKEHKNKGCNITEVEEEEEWCTVHTVAAVSVGDHGGGIDDGGGAEAADLAVGHGLEGGLQNKVC